MPLLLIELQEFSADLLIDRICLAHVLDLHAIFDIPHPLRQPPHALVIAAAILVNSAQKAEIFATEPLGSQAVGHVALLIAKGVQGKRSAPQESGEDGSGNAKALYSQA